MIPSAACFFGHPEEWYELQSAASPWSHFIFIILVLSLIASRLFSAPGASSLAIASLACNYPPCFVHNSCGCDKFVSIRVAKTIRKVVEQGARVQISDFKVCNLVHLILLSLPFICPHTPLSLQFVFFNFTFTASIFALTSLPNPHMRATESGWHVQPPFFCSSRSLAERLEVFGQRVGFVLSTDRPCM